MRLGRTLFLLFLCTVVCYTGYYVLTGGFPDSVNVLQLDGLTPGIITSNSTLHFFNGTGNNAVLLEGDEWKADRFVHLEIDSSSIGQPGLTVTLDRPVPKDARLAVRWRAEGTPDRILIEFSEHPPQGARSRNDVAYYITVAEPGENWSSVSLPIAYFRSSQPTAAGYDGGQLRNIGYVRFTFFPLSHSVIDVREVRFLWREVRWSSILLIVSVLFIGVLLLIRMKKEHLFVGVTNIVRSNSVLARLVYVLFAVSAAIAITERGVIPEGIFPLLAFSFIAVLILIDDFVKGSWTESPVWSYRYLAVMLCAWYGNATHQGVILSLFLLISLLPMAFVKSQLQMISYPLIAAVGLITHPQITMHAAAMPGLFIIAGGGIVCGLVREIYEHERAKRDALYVRSLYEEVLENTSDSIYILDHNGVIIAANRGFELLLGRSSSEIIGKNIRSFIHDNDVSLLDNEQREALKPGEPRHYDLRFRRSTGDIRTALIRETPVVKHLYNTEYQVIAIDITERKQAEAEREKLVDELQNALAEVRALSGLLPICASCKKIRDDRGYWTQLESYIQAHSDAKFTHGMCPECMKELYPDIAAEILELGDKNHP